MRGGSGKSDRKGNGEAHDARLGRLVRSRTRSIVLMLAGTVLSFAGSAVFAYRASAVLADQARTIAFNAAPAIEHLSRARGRLLHLRIALIDTVARPVETAATAPDRLHRLMSEFHREVAAYRSIPLLPQEPDRYQATERLIRRVDAQLETALRQLRAGDHDAAALTIRSGLSPAISRADDAIGRLVTFNAEAQQRLATELRAEEARATSIGYVLYGLSLSFALLLVALVVRNAKQSASLLQARERAAEQRAAELAALSARLESLSVSTPTVFDTITSSTDLHRMFAMIADEARAVVEAARCVLSVRSSDDDEVVVVSGEDAEEAGPRLEVPLHHASETFGRMELSRASSRGEFTEDDARVAELFAAHVAVAIENGRLYRRAQAATRAREDLLATVSHDLRSPLSSIQLAATLLDEDAGSESGAALVRRIHRASERMTRLLRDLLDAAKIEAGQFDVHVEPVELREPVDEAIELFGMAARERSLALAAEVPAGLVLCDRDLLVRVLTNLIGNAIKFTPAGGRITVAAERRGAEVELSVTDTGEGIAPAHLEHLFDRYWQPNGSDRRGSGLGLYIAHGIVEAHGGRISVESTLGAGTTFRITLRAP